MTRNLLLVLLLATGVARADEASPAPGPEAKDKATPAADRKAKAKAPQAPGEAAAAAVKAPEDGGTGETAAKAKPAAAAPGPEDANLGMSILGNQEAPKSLVIVPWKQSELGASLGISPLLDDSRSPVDKEVFMRMLSYYQIRSTTTP